MRIFLAGAVTGVNQEDYRIFDIYKKLVTEIVENVELITPDDIFDYKLNFSKENPNATKKEIAKAMLEFDLKMLSLSDAVIADVSRKSTGLGIELGQIKNQKLLLLAKQGSEVSDMVLGLSYFDIIYYKDIRDLENKLKLKLKLSFNVEVL